MAMNKLERTIILPSAPRACSCRSQAISYTTGVPAMIGAMMILNGIWNKAGVYNIEEFDPDPFMEALNKWGLPWEEDFDPTLVD